MTSRDPLWDSHREDVEVASFRVLDSDKETLGTTELDAIPDRRLLMPEDTLVPLIVAGALAFLFLGLVYGSRWLVVGGVVASLLLTAAWVWPGREFPEAIS